MNLRTPRRRISPRTRRRYRAIREFFRKAIGSSQPDTSININSSIALNVTDLKRKIIGIEQQLEQVSKHCHDVVCLRDTSSKATDSVHQEVNDLGCIKEQSTSSSERKLKGIETRLLYKTSDCIYTKSDESDYEQKQQNVRHKKRRDKMANQIEQPPKIKKNENESTHKDINGFDSTLHKHKTQSAYENFSTAYSTSSFHSLARPRNAHSHAEHVGKRNDRRHYKTQYRSISPGQLKDKKQKEYARRNKLDKYETIYENKPDNSRKHRHERPEVDQDFIADIIRRQYKPVKLFDKRESNISQFSAPICRDQEYSYRENMQEGSGLCSCCHLTAKTRHRHSDLSDVRSICDAHLYSSKRNSRSKHRRRHADLYNDSDLYDLVPVKEKASPKSRRKFAEDNLMPYEAYKEVPPSPRTLRPRLNLQSQHCYEFNDYMAHARRPRQKYSTGRGKRNQVYEVPSMESDIASVAVPIEVYKYPRYPQKTFRPAKIQVGQENIQQSTSTVSNLRSPVSPNGQSHAVVDTSLDKTQETDKTDKALSEIKDILQNFLHEIKKETTASQCDKSDSILKTGEHNTSVLQNSANVNGSAVQNTGQSFNKLSVGQCAIPPYVPTTAFGSPCCYPVVYPVNCMQNGYMMASPSFTCTNCANFSHEYPSENACNKARNKSEKINTETEELIKEIYKFVAQGPKTKRGDSSRKTGYESKKLTSRSVGESHRASKHNAKVGTPNLKYSSKSCEAIGSKMATDNYYTTGASHSDSILERLSLEFTASESDINIKSSEENKRHNNKFSKLLHSLGIFKKKKKDIIVEHSENDSLIDVEIKPKQTRQSPFRQEAMNYMMYQQDYYEPPPKPRPHYQHQSEHPEYHSPYNSRIPEYPQSPINDRYANQQQGYSRTSAYRSPRPSAPYYGNTYHPDTHGPLCLKEIEVKSIATQSERKMTTFQRFKKRLQPPARMPKYEDPQKNCSTQTAKEETPKGTPAKDNLPKWLKKLQEKAMQDNKDKMGMDPKKYSEKTQQELEQGTNNIRNAMIKKLFYKRNPFSPRNLLMNTLIGRDKTSYGVPPPLFKPKLWF